MIIERHTLRWTAEQHLRSILNDYPDSIVIVFEEKIFSKWITMCHNKADELYLKGKINSLLELNHFICSAARSYAYAILNNVVDNNTGA